MLVSNENGVEVRNLGDFGIPRTEVREDLCAINFEEEAGVSVFRNLHA